MPVDGLRLGLELDAASQDRPLVLVLNNVGSTPKDVVFLTNQVGGFEFIVTAPDGARYRVVDRELYTPSAGLAPWQAIETLTPGAIRKFPFTLERFFYVPDGLGKYKTLATLGALLKDGCKAQAHFKLTEQENWKPTKISAEHMWIGELTSGEMRFSEPGK